MDNLKKTKEKKEQFFKVLMEYLQAFMGISAAPIIHDYHLESEQSEMETGCSESESEASEIAPIEKKACGARSSDFLFREAALRTPISDLDFSCSSRCSFKKECALQPGYLPFLIDLRQRFWGSSHAVPPTSKQRMIKIKSELSKFHRGGSIFAFGYTVTRETMDEYIQICEPSYFKALGTMKTSQWHRAMEALRTGNGPVKGKGRANFKTSKVKAFIVLFLGQCDMPPGRGMQNIKILPFPSVRQFYEEYQSSFKAPYLTELSPADAIRYKSQIFIGDCHSPNLHLTAASSVALVMVVFGILSIKIS